MLKRKQELLPDLWALEGEAFWIDCDIAFPKEANEATMDLRADSPQVYNVSIPTSMAALMGLPDLDEKAFWKSQDMQVWADRQADLMRLWPYYWSLTSNIGLCKYGRRVCVVNGIARLEANEATANDGGTKSD